MHVQVDQGGQAPCESDLKKREKEKRMTTRFENFGSDSKHFSYNIAAELC